jgi:uncharacterized membrane protein
MTGEENSITVYCVPLCAYSIAIRISFLNTRMAGYPYYLSWQKLCGENMITNIPVGAKVICSDGKEGRSTAVVVEPGSKTVTHVAIVEKSLLHGEEHLVPIEKVTKTTRDTIELNCPLDEVLQMPPFTRTRYLEIENGESGYAYSAPYVTMHSGMGYDVQPQYITVQDQLLPEGEFAIQRGMLVEALDGHVGEVGELLIDPATRQVSHILLMKGHLWGKKEVAIAVSDIERGDEDTLYLKIDKAKIEQLPSLPVKRAWNEVFATDLELMVWTFDGRDLARKAQEQAEELCNQYAIELLNVTVLEKDEKGEMHIHEEKKVPSKRRITLGIALGGLAGLIVGPIALVAGAIGGAVAGKKSAEKVEVGFSEEKLRKLNDTLAPGGSALFLLVEHRWFNTLEVEMAGTGGQLIHERLSDLSYDELLKKLAEEEESSQV